ncbi:hypothetical protein FB451DRAFT_1516922 [Mycena latifolia]|nr:hypothetical protein FB451DRAFT_1516922 [Mycena latifolia]
MSHDSSSPPPSQGPHRTYSSPHRYAPYSSDRRTGQHWNENFAPIGPGQAGGDFQGHYVPYDGFSGGYSDRSPFSALQNHSHGSRLPALTTVVSVDELSTEYGLDNAQRKAAHSFCKLSNEDRALVLYLRILRAEKQNTEITEQLEGIQDDLKSVGEFCVQSWHPSKEQLKLLKSLLRHYIIRPLTSYNNLVSLSETYIHDHAKRLRLELYKTDPTVKTVVREMLTAENNGVRSALRKLIWASLKEKMTLMDFSKKIISTHHLPTILTTPPKDIMACLALMRKVAHPLLGKETTRGGDTGFWTNMEKELDHLFEKNGNSRTNADWIKWEQEIIDQDNRKYNRYAAESHARTREEIDAAGLPGGGEALTGPVADDRARPAANDEARSVANGRDDVANGGDNEDQATRDGRDVNVSALGDLASLSSDVVAR